MTSKERCYAALEGRSVDRMPVAALYSFLYYMDHFEELTGRPQWQWQQWLHAAPDEHMETYAKVLEAAPFEMLQPLMPPGREVRDNTEFFERDGQVFKRSKGQVTPVQARGISGHAFDDRENQTQRVFNKADADRLIVPVPAEKQRSWGTDDYIDAVVSRYGRDHFIISHGVVGVLYSCSWYVGMTCLYEMLADQPDLIEHMCTRILDQNIETIRRLAMARGDAIYIDDATATCDMISVAHYERFSLPYMVEMVREIHRLGHKAILIYFGGVMDRLEQIASIGADGLSVETSMKGYVNDMDVIAETIGNRVALFANVDPVGVLQCGSDEEMEAEIVRQVAAGRKARGFIISPSSPITPSTPLSRVRKFLELASTMGGARP